MRRLVDLEKLDRLDNLIRREATGTPNELAKRLEVSRSSLFELIAYLKDTMRAPIVYFRCKPSYVYEYTPKFYLGFERERLQYETLASIHGGTEEFEINKDFECDALQSDETPNIVGGERNKNEKKRIIEIRIDDHALDHDIDFSNLYH